MRRLPIAILAALSLSAASAGAQPAPPLAKPPSAPPAPTGIAAIEVSDPLLTPLPPAQRTLASWRDVITQLNSRSTDIIIAKAEIERSRGLARQALGLALGSITATGLAEYDIIRGPKGTVTNTSGALLGTYSTASHTVSGTITASIPVFALQTWYNVGTADRAVKVTEMTEEDRLRTVLAAVANAIVVVFTTERVAEVNRVGLKSALQTLELTTRKQKLGSGTQLDVVRASQDVSSARATLISGDESLRQAREALGLALGYTDAWGVANSVSLDEIGDRLRRICEPAKPEERPDIRSARANLEVAERGVTASHLAYVPTITASSTATAGNTTLNSSPPAAASVFIPNGNSYSWNIQGLLTIPIWEGGVRYGTTRIAKAQQTEAKATLDLLTRAAQQQVVQSNRGVEVAEASKAVAQQTRDLAKETARLSQVAFEAGTGTSFDLVTSQALARQAELAYAQSEFSLVQARISALLAASNCKY